MIQRLILICAMAIILLGMMLSASLSAQTDIREFRSCTQCGMDRKAYGFSRMMIVYKDGGKAGVCSLHCAVTEMNEHKESIVISILVADRNSHEMIEAGKASWVVGGNKRGVMTKIPKWAFETNAAAQSFVDSNGGKITSWDRVLLAAREEADSLQ